MQCQGPTYQLGSTRERHDAAKFQSLDPWLAYVISLMVTLDPLFLDVPLEMYPI